MPYILSSFISNDLNPLWGEGAPYDCCEIYHIAGNPPVNYSSHTLKPHSMCHVDGPNHIIENAGGVETYFNSDSLTYLWGEVFLLKIKKPNWKKINLNNLEVFHYEIQVDELKEELKRLLPTHLKPKRLFVTLEDLPVDLNNMHDSNYALTLSEESAKWLLEGNDFCTYGTSWKSTDFKPGSRERPIHRLFLKKGVIYECLDLKNVPEGRYFLSGFPLPIKGASESPVCPVLFEYSELK